MAKGKCMNLSAMVIFGTIGIFVRHIGLPSSLIALTRAAVGLVFLLAVLAVRRQKPDFSAIRKKLPLLILSGIFLGANWIALFEAYRHTSIAIATVCYYFAPLIVLILSPYLLKERYTTRHSFSWYCAMLGILLVIGPWGSGGSPMGPAFGFLAAALYAGVILTNRKLTGLTPFDTTLVQLAVAALVLAPYVLLTVDLAALAPTPTELGLLAVVGVVHTGLAYTLYFGSIAHLPARTVAMFGYLDPIVAVFLSAALLGEPLSAMNIAGTILVLAATALSERRN